MLVTSPHRPHNNIRQTHAHPPTESATRLQAPTDLASRIGISAGLEEQLYDRRMTII
jgi:hypothetical protein